MNENNPKFEQFNSCSDCTQIDECMGTILDVGLTLSIATQIAKKIEEEIVENKGITDLDNDAKLFSIDEDKKQVWKIADDYFSQTKCGSYGLAIIELIFIAEEHFLESPQ